MKRLHFLAVPPFVKSGSDAIGPRSVAELKKNGVEASLLYLWPDHLARRFLSSGSNFWRRVFRRGIVPASLLRFVNRFGPHDIIWIYDASWYANPQNVWLEEHLVRRGAKLVFQLHDDWLSVPGYDIGARKRIQLADMVAGITPGILASISSVFPDTPVRYLRAPIDVDRLKPPSKPVPPQLPTVVWTGNPSNLKEIPHAGGVLRNVYSKAKFDFVLISGHQKPALDLPIPWSWLPYDEKLESERISGACAGLAPLEDRPYARCKDVFKVKTYMACGVPPIATAIGGNLDVIQDGETGFLVSSQEAWEQRLLELISNSALARRMGQAAREVCVNRYSHSAIIPEWIETLEKHFGALRT